MSFVFLNVKQSKELIVLVARWRRGAGVRGTIDRGRRPTSALTQMVTIFYHYPFFANKCIDSLVY